MFTLGGKGGGSDSDDDNRKKPATGVQSTPPTMKQRTTVAQTPNSIFKYLKENRYGEKGVGNNGIYIMVCIDFLNEREMDHIADWWYKFFEANPRAMPENYNIDAQYWPQVKHRIYKAGRTAEMGIGRHFSSAKTISSSPPNLDMWLYHTWVSFNNSDGEDLQKDIETLFLLKLTEWRMNPDVKLGQTEMIFGCSLENKDKESLQYIVHSSVLDVIIGHSQQRRGHAAEFEWKNNGTRKDLFSRKSVRLGQARAIPKFTMNCKYETDPDGGDDIVVLNDSMKLIIEKAGDALAEYDYLTMYR